MFYFARNILIIIMASVLMLYPDFSIAKTKKAKPHKTITVKKTVKKSTKKIHVRKIAKHRLKRKKPAQSVRHIVKATTKINSVNIAHAQFPSYLFSSMEKTLIKFVRNTIEGIRYTAYKLGGTKIDSSRGIYVIDCSRYVDHILKTIYPRAYVSLTEWSGTEKPTTYDFYNYFQNLSEDSRHWNTVNDVEELRPGDILVFRNKNRYGMETGGHVMVVMDKPARKGNIFLVRIADSAPSGHSKDTRMPHASGIGIGSMLLKVNPHTSLPDAYAWKVGSRWESNVNFAMARPVDFG